MPHLREPQEKRAIAFFDGQNLYRSAKTSFGYTHPNADPIKLFNAICAQERMLNQGVRFYTGTPNAQKDPRWHDYWARRLLAMRRAGICVVSREIRYHEQEVSIIGGLTKKIDVAREKGIDVRIALDIVRLAYDNSYDVCVIFSQDQDLKEAVDEIMGIASQQKRWLRVCSAFPSSENSTNKRGINRTDWLRIDRSLYDACIDPRDYRAKT